ncbi:hypothetical protein CBL_00235 [Carabus blaptoides fortunei]
MVAPSSTVAATTATSLAMMTLADDVRTRRWEGVRRGYRCSSLLAVFVRGGPINRSAWYHEDLLPVYYSLMYSMSVFASTSTKNFVHCSPPFLPSFFCPPSHFCCRPLKEEQ